MLEKFTEQTDTIRDDTPLSEVLIYFRDRRAAQVVPVVDSRGAPLGVLRERDLKGYVYSTFGKEVLLNRSLKKSLHEFIHKSPVCDINTRIDTVLDIFSEVNEKDGILITKDGIYHGYLSTISMLKILNEKQLLEKNRKSVDSLVVGIAHEMNTPIGIGITSASLMDSLLCQMEKKFREGKLKRKEMESLLESLLDTSQSLLPNLQRAASLVQTFKQISGKQEKEAHQSVKLGEFVSYYVKSEIARCSEYDIRFSLECPEEIETGILQNALREVLSSLFMNALIHGFGETRQGRIAIKIEARGDYVAISFSDNGAGMDPKTLKQVFEPFFTTKRGNYTGLGMHLVQSIVTHRMKGHIECWSEPGRGTTVVVTIPYHR